MSLNAFSNGRVAWPTNWATICRTPRKIDLTCLAPHLPLLASAIFNNHFENTGSAAGAVSFFNSKSKELACGWALADSAELRESCKCCRS